MYFLRGPTFCLSAVFRPDRKSTAFVNFFNPPDVVDICNPASAERLQNKFLYHQLLIRNNMAKQIFINLAVKDLQKSMDFYAALGFTNNPQFSDDTAKCMVWIENIFVMIMTHEKFATFATKPIADTKSKLAGLFSLSVDSVDEVNSITNAGLNAGGTEPHEMRDYGFMQQRTIEDFDGHTWEIFYMDITKFPAEQPNA
jgi:predicted lactoylglutathione lyase